MATNVLETVMNIKSLALKLLALILLAAAGFSIWFLIHIVLPSGFQSRQAEGPKVLTEVLAMAEESQPFNSDPYISSTYRPGDVLYEPLLAIQRHRNGIARKLLEPLAERNNADALYWLGEITYGLSAFSGRQAGEYFERSAELGNPYAALRLDVDDYDCQRYMRGYCNEKWGRLGRKILQERADNGDLKAEYALLDFDEFSDKDTHLELEHLVTENAKKYYYRPLMNMLTLYEKKWHYPYLSEDEELSLDDKLILNKLKSLMINNNYTIAYHWYDDSINNIYQLDDVVKKYIYIDSSLSLCSYYFPRKKM